MFPFAETHLQTLCANRQTTLGVNHQPTLGVDHRPTLGVNHQPTLGVNHQPTLGVKYRPTFGVNHQTPMLGSETSNGRQTFLNPPRSQTLGLSRTTANSGRDGARIQRPSWMQQRKGKVPKKSKKVKLSLWEHEFICLANCGQSSPPSAMDKIDLIRAGLGPKKIPFLDFGESYDFHDEIISAFPKLLDAGGYELLRTQQNNTRELFVIQPPSGGYTVQYLRSIVGQAKVFIRPIQKDLCLDPLLDDKDEVVCKYSFCVRQ